MIERERRFLVTTVPAELPPPHHIVQGYLSTRPAAIRVRRQDDTHTLTIKTGSGLRRVEIERNLDAEEFEALWAVTTALRIEKRRHVIGLADGHLAELDLFDGELAGRRIVEVEFDDDDEAGAFEPPAWFGREVTDDGRYSNASLATSGWPAES
jgi:adenylate cyclase